MTNDDREKMTERKPTSHVTSYFSVYTKEPEWTWILDEEENPASQKS